MTPLLQRPAQACKTLGISRATLCHWAVTRQGFPQPLRPSPRVTLHDIDAILKWMGQQG